MRNALRSILILLLLVVPVSTYASPTYTSKPVPSTHHVPKVHVTASRHTPTRHIRAVHRMHRPSAVHRTDVKAKNSYGGTPINMIHESTSNEQCLAIALYREARGEGERGMAGVGYVITNRVHSKRFPPTTVCGVIRQAGQFPWVKVRPAGKIHAASYAQATRVAKQVLAGTIANPVGDSLFFHEARSSRGAPARYASHRIVLGHHVFYGPRPARAIQLAAR